MDHIEKAADAVIRGIYKNWHACGLRKAERGMPVGTLCDMCQEEIRWRVAQMMDLIKSSST